VKRSSPFLDRSRVVFFASPCTMVSFPPCFAECRRFYTFGCLPVRLILRGVHRLFLLKRFSHDLPDLFIPPLSGRVSGRNFWYPPFHLLISLPDVGVFFFPPKATVFFRCQRPGDPSVKSRMFFYLGASCPGCLFFFSEVCPERLAANPFRIFYFSHCNPVLPCRSVCSFFCFRYR